MLILRKRYLLKKITNYWQIKSYYDSIIMEYQKIANFLNDGSNKPSKFRTRNWVEINDEVRVHTLIINKLNLKYQC